jgi:hypothetical protein
MTIVAKTKDSQVALPALAKIAAAVKAMTALGAMLAMA